MSDQSRWPAGSPGGKGGEFAPQSGGRGTRALDPGGKGPRGDGVVAPPPPRPPALHSDEAVKDAASKVLASLPRQLQYEVENFTVGVLVGVAPQVEQRLKELHVAFAPVRQLLRERHGPVLSLYRGEPEARPSVQRRMLSWAADPHLAAGFAEHGGSEGPRRLVSARVAVDDVIAVLTSPHNRDYVEFLVRERPEYHRRGKPLPLLGYVDLHEKGPHTEAQLRRLASDLRRAGGDVIRVRHDSETEPDVTYVTATVLVPKGHAPIDDRERMPLGTFEVEYPRPYSGKHVRSRKYLP